MHKTMFFVVSVVIALGLMFSPGTFVLAEDIPYEEEPGDPALEWCARTQGFWKNHPEAWTVDGLILGDVYYTNDALLDLLNAPVRRDKRLILIKQLIAAKLNVAASGGGLGAYEVEEGWTVDLLIPEADIALCDDVFVWDEDVEHIKNLLDEFNNSEECAGGGDAGDDEPVA